MQARFLMRFLVVGGIWLLAFPLTVLVVAPRFPPYHRHCIVSALAVLLQSGALCGMLTLFLGLGTHGKAFIKASTISAMGDLSAQGPVGAMETRGPAPSSAPSITSAIRRKVAVD